MRGKIEVSGVDRCIAALAERQHGVVGRVQLLKLGIGTRAIEHRIARDRLHALYRGVYAVGHRAVRREAHWMGATLATADAVLSHRSAAALWGLLAHDGVPEITIPRWRPRRAGLLQRVARIAEDERTVRDGIAVTTVPRTLLDLAAVLGRSRLELIVGRAEAERLGDALSLADLVARYPGRRGVATLRAILGETIDPRITRSELEARFYVLISNAGLPLPLAEPQPADPDRARMVRSRRRMACGAPRRRARQPPPPRHGARV